MSDRDVFHLWVIGRCGTSVNRQTLDYLWGKILGGFVIAVVHDEYGPEIKIISPFKSK